MQVTEMLTGTLEGIVPAAAEGVRPSTLRDRNISGEFWRTWSFLTQRLEQLREASGNEGISR